MDKFRTLYASEIECRISTVKEDSTDTKGNLKRGGVQLLLYKDARVDQNLLDEVVGPMNWQKHYSRDNANCVVSIWDDDKKMWIEKEDVGKESYTEAEKGLASDSFKRACFNWGIGRELYTAPFIWISTDKCNVTSGKKCYDEFEVKKIGYDDQRRINALVIINAKTRKTVWTYGADADVVEVKESPVADERVTEASAKARVIAYVNNAGMTKKEIESLCKMYGVDSLQGMDLQRCNHYINFIKNQGGQI